MDPKDYTGKEWDDLLREMNAQQIKASIRGAMRAEAKKAVAIAQRYLASSGLNVQGDTADWKKGIRYYIYSPSRATGFLVTVKARAASRKTGKGEKSMHRNRFGARKPILMWAVEGTQPRKRGGRKFTVKNGIYGTHRTEKNRYWKETYRIGGVSTGRMGKYPFLEEATSEMFQNVENGLTPELGKAVVKVARKCGFV